MGQAFYRKYRSKKLSEIVGQEHITRTLEHALKQGKISHAYLFTGPRGVGKTSIARILAHEVNGLPYNDESIHLDIIEIDAASNRRIDEIRDLRDKVHIAPTSSKYKVYIIDEVHMLTKEAFNALLKTLEEPPAHVIFILATTEAHKLPETIISRTQRFTFKPVERGKAADHLRTIAKSEDVSIDDDALELLADHGGGSFRDSISLLDQVAAMGKKHVSKKDVESMLGIAPEAAINKLLKATLEASAGDIVEQLLKLREQGINPAIIAKQLHSVLRQRLVAREYDMQDIEAIMKLMADLLAVSASPVPESTLELVLIDANLHVSRGQAAYSPPAATTVTLKETVVPIAATIEQDKSHELKAESSEPSKTKSDADKKAKAGKAPEPQLSAQSPKLAAPSSSASAPGSLDEWWPKVIASIKKNNNTLYGILRMAEPELNGDELKLKFAFPFHQKRLNEAKNREKVTSCITEIVGQNLVIVCEVDDTLRNRKAVSVETVSFEPPVDGILPADVGTPLPTDETLQTITNIFGGGEVL